MQITQIKEQNAFFDQQDGESLSWILNEGHMVKSFLHLEDIKQDLSVKKLWINGQSSENVDDILTLFMTSIAICIWPQSTSLLRKFVLSSTLSIYQEFNQISILC